MKKLFEKKVTLTAAQVNALDSTPITIIPAPASGKMIVVESMIVSKTSGTAVGSATDDPIGLVYTGDTTLIFLLDAVGAATVTNAVISTGATAATYLTVEAAKVEVNEARSVLSGKGIDITAPGATIGSFDGTLDVTITFAIKDI